MGVFEEMDPMLAWKLIEGHADLLSPRVAELDELYARFRCPRCKVGLHKEFDSRHVFNDPDELAPRALLRCPVCAYLIDPHTRVVVRFGDASKVPIDPIPIIGGTK